MNYLGTKWTKLYCNLIDLLWILYENYNVSLSVKSGICKGIPINSLYINYHYKCYLYHENKCTLNNVYLQYICQITPGTVLEPDLTDFQTLWIFLISLSHPHKKYKGKVHTLAKCIYALALRIQSCFSGAKKVIVWIRYGRTQRWQVHFIKWYHLKVIMPASSNLQLIEY